MYIPRESGATANQKCIAQGVPNLDLSVWLQKFARIQMYHSFVDSVTLSIILQKKTSTLVHYCKEEDKYSGVETEDQTDVNSILIVSNYRASHLCCLWERIMFPGLKL